MLHALLLTLATLAPPKSARADSILWKIDPASSEVSFRIRHFLTKVRGRFPSFTGTIVADPAQLNSGRVDVVIQTASVNTANPRRDADVRSANHLQVDSFPTITFKSKKVEFKGGQFTVVGDLTIRGVTKEVALAGEYNGTSGPVGPGQRIGFSATTTINRLDFGLKWNRVIEGSSVMGDEVDIDLNIDAVRQ